MLWMFFVLPQHLNCLHSKYDAANRLRYKFYFIYFRLVTIFFVLSLGLIVFSAACKKHECILRLVSNNSCLVNTVHSTQYTRSHPLLSFPINIYSLLLLLQLFSLQTIVIKINMKCSLFASRAQTSYYTYIH